MLKDVKVDGKPFASETKTLFEAKPSSYTPSIFNSIYTLILVLLLVVLVNKKWLNLFYFSVIGLVGLFFCLVGFYSFHEEVRWNYNVALFNPLYLVFVYFYFKNQKQNIIFVGKIILAILLIYVVYIVNKVHFYIVLPFVIMHFIFLARMILAGKKHY
ncbi:MAG: hypothetical protein HC854_07230 [Flavobacterium sp.]|nr:hypothetical protein [Flavobacterium sp.]